MCFAGMVAPFPAQAEDLSDDEFRRLATEVFGPVMDKYDIPGVVIGVTWKGQHHLVATGIADRGTAAEMTADTLFELGSLSKTLNVTLAALAAERGLLALDDSVADHLPDLADSAVGKVSLDDLAASQTGGLPVQIPGEVKDMAGLMGWLSDWTPVADPNGTRSYSNISIGLLGVIAAQAFGQDYGDALASKVTGPLHMDSTFIDIPADAMPRYAFGHAKDGARVRVNPGVLDDEAYGVKSTGPDMLRFLDAHLGQGDAPADLSAALRRTEAGLTRTRPFTQAMIWERYAWPADRAALAQATAPDMAMKPQPATRLDAPDISTRGVLLAKTGSTNGFGGYVALLPDEDLGLVVLANRAYPNLDRAEAGVSLIERLLADAQ